MFSWFSGFSGVSGGSKGHNWGVKRGYKQYIVGIRALAYIYSGLPHNLINKGENRYNINTDEEFHRSRLTERMPLL